MINRSYLPFQSARDYQDTGMQKWMGFFLSEHTSALSSDANKVTHCSELTMEMKYLLLSQLYTNQLIACITISEGNKLKQVIGTIPSLSPQYVLVKTTKGHISISTSEMITIELVEEVYHEST